MKEIVIIGAGSALEYSLNIIEKESKYMIVGIIDSKVDIGTDLFGYRVIGRQEEILSLVEELGIEGGIMIQGDNYSRKIVYDAITSIIPDFYWINAIHPSCIIADGVKMGIGILMIAGVVVNSGATLGDFSHYYTGCQIEHNCEISEFASVSAGTTLGGFVKIGKYSAVTLGCTIIDRLIIGQNSVLGSGSLLVESIGDNQLWYGHPAKFIRTRKLGEKFLK